jgi:hypothetical protein
MPNPLPGCSIPFRDVDHDCQHARVRSSPKLGSCSGYTYRTAIPTLLRTAGLTVVKFFLARNKDPPANELNFDIGLASQVVSDLMSYHKSNMSLSITLRLLCPVFVILGCNVPTRAP